jgi:signal transduction histidine kinase
VAVLIISILLGILSLILGLVVILRDGSKAYNKVFFAVALLSAIWSIIFASIEQPSSIEVVDLLNRLAYFFGFILMQMTVLFTYYFPRKRSLKSSYAYLIVTLPVLFLSLFEPIAGSVSIDAAGNYVFEYGDLAYLYSIAMFGGAALIVRNGLIARKNASKTEKNQIQLILLGFSLSLIIGVGLSVVLPIINEATVYDDLAPASLIFLVGLTAYAIFKHKLFDIRLIIFRSLSYFSLIAFIVVLYVSTAFLFKRLLIPDLQVSTPQLISNILLAVLLVSTYPYLKKFVDKISSSIFYRDAYDPQSLIARLNQTLVTNVELEELLTKSALIMQEEMKASFATFYIRETSYFSNRIIGAHRKTPEFDEIDEIEKNAAKIHSKVFSTDAPSDVESDKSLAKALKKNDVEVMARLTNTLDFEVKGIGYIFMGPKKSGSQYGSNDLKIIEIIANELVIAIENVLRFEEIEQFSVTLQKKIDDATKELKESNDKLKALDEAKDEFVSMASHQLRTPLTSIKGYLSMVLEGDAGEITETQKTMLGQAFFSSQRMVYLISDLLNVSRLKTGKFIIESKPVYLPNVVESEIQQLVEGANAKNLTLSFTKPKEFSTLNLDEMKLRQVIMNFTDNAIYYTPAGGKITIELKETAKSVEFTVKDTGIGVPKEQQHKLYTKFYRADNARKTRPDGTGLGLFMAKKVIIAQGGSMIFNSKEGVGSTFGFSFPKERLLVANNITK